MKLKRSPNPMAVGLAASVVTMGLLSILVPAGGVAVAQDQPTGTPVPTETPAATAVPTVEIQSAFALTPGGDLNGDGVINPGDTVT